MTLLVHHLAYAFLRAGSVPLVLQEANADRLGRLLQDFAILTLLKVCDFNSEYYFRGLEFAVLEASVVADDRVGVGTDASDDEQESSISELTYHHLVPLDAVRDDEVVLILNLELVPHRALLAHGLQYPEILRARRLLTRVKATIDAAVYEEIAVVRCTGVKRPAYWRLVLELHLGPGIEAAELVVRDILTHLDKVGRLVHRGSEPPHWES